MTENPSSSLIDIFVNSPANMDLPEQLRWMRRAAKKTQQQLSRDLGIGQSLISSREKGKVAVTVDAVMEWAEVCGFRGGLYFVEGDTDGDIIDLIQQADPDTLDAVVRLLRTLPKMSPELRRTILAMLETVEAQARL